MRALLCMVGGMIAVASLSGCAGLLWGMDAGQIAASVKDKNSTAQCIQVTGTGGQVIILNMNNDKGVISNGTANLKCGSAEAVFTDTKKAP